MACCVSASLPHGNLPRLSLHSSSGFCRLAVPSLHTPTLASSELSCPGVVGFRVRQHANQSLHSKQVGGTIDGTRLPTKVPQQTCFPCLSTQIVSDLLWDAQDLGDQSLDKILKEKGNLSGTRNPHVGPVRWFSDHGFTLWHSRNRLCHKTNLRSENHRIGPTVRVGGTRNCSPLTTCCTSCSRLHNQSCGSNSCSGTTWFRNLSHQERFARHETEPTIR